MRRASRAGAAAPRGNPAGASVFCMAPLDPVSAESDACIRAYHAAWLAARGTRSTTHEFKHRSRQENLSVFRIVRNGRVLRRDMARAPCLSPLSPKHRFIRRPTRILDKEGKQQ